MNIVISEKYIILPINTHAPSVRVEMKIGDELVYPLDVSLDPVSPNFPAYIDVERFMGKPLTIVCNPEKSWDIQTSNELDIPNLYQEEDRPYIHHTPRYGWLNDPNGLIHFNGKYHMFYQYFPASLFHGENKHWGHAVSDDLINWEETGSALFPDGKDNALWSGSAIIDTNNVLNLQKGDTPTVALFYTSKYDDFCVQKLAYSTDGLKTVHKYSDEPIIDTIIGFNRDPKVVFCEELNSYVMVLFLEKTTYSFLASNDLKNWKEFQRINLNCTEECPDIFMLHDENGNRRWVLMGATGNYCVGEFKDGKYIPLQSTINLVYGCSAYAGQTFSDMPDGRVVRVDWGCTFDIPATRFTQQLSIPMELSLKKHGDTQMLCASPVKELENQVADSKVYKNFTLTKANPLELDLQPAAYRIRLNGVNDRSTKIRLTIFSREIICDLAQNQCILPSCTSPLTVTDNFDIDILMDTWGFETFADGGKFYLNDVTGACVMDKTSPFLKIEILESAVTNANEYIFNEIKIDRFKPMRRKI